VRGLQKEVLLRRSVPDMQAQIPLHQAVPLHVCRPGPGGHGGSGRRPEQGETEVSDFGGQGCRTTTGHLPPLRGTTTLWYLLNINSVAVGVVMRCVCVCVSHGVWVWVGKRGGSMVRSFTCEILSLYLLFDVLSFSAPLSSSPPKHTPPEPAQKELCLQRVPDDLLPAMRG
jgi:hypothetical protein